MLPLWFLLVPDTSLCKFFLITFLLPMVPIAVRGTGSNGGCGVSVLIDSPEVSSIFSHTSIVALETQVSISFSLSVNWSPCRSRLQYLNKYRMKCDEILYRLGLVHHDVDIFGFSKTSQQLLAWTTAMNFSTVIPDAQRLDPWIEVDTFGADWSILTISLWSLVQTLKLSVSS